MKTIFIRRKAAFINFIFLILLTFILSPFSLNAQIRTAVNNGSIEVQRNPTYYNYTPQQLVEELFVKKGGCVHLLAI